MHIFGRNRGFDTNTSLLENLLTGTNFNPMKYFLLFLALCELSVLEQLEEGTPICLSGGK